MPELHRGKRLTIYIGEYDRYHHHSLAHAILERAREEGLAGATMFRGIEGFGPSGRLKTTRFLSSSDDLPIVIEIVDDEHRIHTFLRILDVMVSDGLITIDNTDIFSYHATRPLPLDDDP